MQRNRAQERNIKNKKKYDDSSNNNIQVHINVGHQETDSRNDESNKVDINQDLVDKKKIQSQKQDDKFMVEEQDNLVKELKTTLKTFNLKKEQLINSKIDIPNNIFDLPEIDLNTNQDIINFTNVIKNKISILDNLLKTKPLDTTQPTQTSNMIPRTIFPQYSMPILRSPFGYRYPGQRPTDFQTPIIRQPQAQPEPKPEPEQPQPQPEPEQPQPQPETVKPLPPDDEIFQRAKSIYDNIQIAYPNIQSSENLDELVEANILIVQAIDQLNSLRDNAKPIDAGIITGYVTDLRSTYNMIEQMKIKLQGIPDDREQNPPVTPEVPDDNQFIEDPRPGLLQNVEARLNQIINYKNQATTPPELGRSTVGYDFVLKEVNDLINNLEQLKVKITNNDYLDDEYNTQMNTKVTQDYSADHPSAIAFRRFILDFSSNSIGLEYGEDSVINLQPDPDSSGQNKYILQINDFPINRQRKYNIKGYVWKPEDADQSRDDLRRLPINDFDIFN